MFNIREKDVERDILRCLSLLPWVKVFKINNVGIFDQKTNRYRLPHSPFILKGISDILGVARINGRGIFLAIEVKTPMRKSQISDTQKGFLNMIAQMGGIAFMATSATEALEKLNNAKNEIELQN